MKRRFALLLGGTAVLAILVAIDPTLGTQVMRARSATSPSTSQDVLVLRTGTGPQAALLSLPGGDSRVARRLPLGLFERTGHTLYAAIPQAHDRTLVSAIDVVSGATLRSITVGGTFSTRTGDYALSTPLTQPSKGSATHGLPASSPAIARTTATRLHAVPAGGIPADTTETIATLSYDGGGWRSAIPGSMSSRPARS